MSSGVTPYTFPPTIRSSLLKSPTDAIPPTDDLEALQAELRALRQKTLERMKKAGDDIIAIQESFKRLKEKEKGKGKAIEKVKKERDCTCRSYLLCGRCHNHAISTYIQLRIPPMATQSHHYLMATRRGYQHNLRAY